MKITSPVFANQENIPSKYTCDGENINPPLKIEDVPNVTVSLVLIMDDPDTPNGTFVHWVLYNIDPQAREIVEDSVTGGAMLGITSTKQKGYMGPCPPFGVHRYFFKLYALDSLLSVDHPTADDLNLEMDTHIIDGATLIGLYAR
ncbi:MAG: YbhB/YbcL family Raf kinase inhibitor-like protein [bacterium]|nr:YbhB/YbcL family Raf kinase inhibitor-like protein [bacterium]